MFRLLYNTNLNMNIPSREGGMSPINRTCNLAGKFDISHFSDCKMMEKIRTFL